MFQTISALAPTQRLRFLLVLHVALGLFVLNPVASWQAWGDGVPATDSVSGGGGGGWGPKRAPGLGKNHLAGSQPANVLTAAAAVDDSGHVPNIGALHDSTAAADLALVF